MASNSAASVQGQRGHQPGRAELRAVGRERAVAKVTALGREAGPRVNASVLQSN